MTTFRVRLPAYALASGPSANPMSDPEQKAFDFAQETTKQLLTLATAIFALTLTFIKEIANTEKAKDVLGCLHWGWGFYIASVAFGVLTLMMLAGNLERPHSGAKPSIYGANIVVTSIGQVATFAIALIFTAILASGRPDRYSPSEASIPMARSSARRMLSRSRWSAGGNSSVLAARAWGGGARRNSRCSTGRAAAGVLAPPIPRTCGLTCRLCLSALPPSRAVSVNGSRAGPTGLRIGRKCSDPATCTCRIVRFDDERDTGGGIGP
jgi:hypothetical protein